MLTEDLRWALLNVSSQEIPMVFADVFSFLSTFLFHTTFTYLYPLSLQKITTHTSLEGEEEGEGKGKEDVIFLRA